MKRPKSRIAINRVYTRTGDDGTTALVGGARVSKDALRIEAYGTVDELNATLGAARTVLPPAAASIEPELQKIQSQLFDLGSELATPPDTLIEGMPVVTPAHIEAMERLMDELLPSLPSLRSFVLPGGGHCGALLHVSRTVCRRAERVVLRLSRAESVRPDALKYLNRLSDLLFVLSRWVSRQANEPELLWQRQD